MAVLSCKGRSQTKREKTSTAIRMWFPLVAVFQPGDSLLQITRDTQAIRFYAFCQTKMSGFLNAFFQPFSLRSIRFLNGRKRAKKYPVLPAYPNAGANDGQHMVRFTHRFPLCSLYVQSYAFYENVKKQGSFLYFSSFLPFCKGSLFFFSITIFFFLSLFYLSIS